MEVGEGDSLSLTALFWEAPGLWVLASRTGAPSLEESWFLKTKCSQGMWTLCCLISWCSHTLSLNLWDIWVPPLAYSDTWSNGCIREPGVWSLKALEKVSEPLTKYKSPIEAPSALLAMSVLLHTDIPRHTLCQPQWSWHHYASGGWPQSQQGL